MLLNEVIVSTRGDLSEEQLLELKEIQRTQDLMTPSEGKWKTLFEGPGYSPAIRDLSQGWETADAMRDLIAYEFPTTLMRSAVLYKGTEVKPAVTDPKKTNYDLAQTLAEECHEMIHSIENPETTTRQSLRGVLWEMMDGCHYGHTAIEKKWRMAEIGPLEGRWVLQRLTPRHPRDIGFDLDPQTLEVLHVTRRYAPTKGGVILPDYLSDRRIPAEKFLIYTFHPFKSLPYGMGHFRPCYKPAHFISAMYRLWGRAQEKTGIPFPYIISNSGVAEIMEEQRKLIDAMMQGYGVVFPPNVQAQWVNAVQGVSDGFERAVLHMKGEIVHLILFQNLTTNADGKSSYALGEVHQATQEYALAQVRLDLEEKIGELFRDYVRYNYGPAFVSLAPKFSLGLWGLAELNMLADIFVKYITAGVLFPEEEFIRELAKFKPRPEELALKHEQMRQEELNLKRQQPAATGSGGN